MSRDRMDEAFAPVNEAYGSSDGQPAFAYDDERYNKMAKYRKYKVMFFGALLIFAVLAIGYIFIDPFAHKEQKPFLTILQMNDVYELNAVGGAGGFPKVKTYRDSLVKSEEYLMTVLAGDFFSPSALGVAQVKIGDEPEKPLHGRQIVDVMNHLGSKKEDFLVTFGNHEYDISEDSFYSRIGESQFTYISTNVDAAKGHVWPSHVVPYYFKTIGDKTIAFISLSILVDSSLPYIKQYSFKDSVKKIRATVDGFKAEGKKYDILIGITHQSLADDSTLVSQIPELDLVMGGHEHENWKINRSMNPKHPIYVCKADANAKTVFKHSFYWDKSKLKTEPNATPYARSSQIEGLVTIKSELVAMDHNIQEDKGMAEITAKWTNLGFQAFIDKGLDPGRVMCHLTTYINAMDKVTRATVSAMGSFLTDAFLAAATPEYTIPNLPNYRQKFLSVANIGSVRIDDYLVMGDLYEYDALRILPFGGEIAIVELTGSKLLAMLDRARGKLGSGMWMGYNPNELQCPEAGEDVPPLGCKWLLGNEQIVNDDSIIYTVVIPTYVINVGWNEWFASQDDFKVVVPKIKLDQQHALIEHFGRVYPIPQNGAFKFY